ncbi:MAG TPA: sulfite exporter TauE/SafE family protein [Solirubrobacterales bacterium]|jgi:uncharacterized membrane protein YfcA|nr:sulfite exporter TauE/SafE family protein [Solirubrobacterales bacterium]
MDPLLIVFGFGVGILVGMTGMGGGSLMTPLLVLLFGVKPTLAVGTDIGYQAITKTVGGIKHFKLKTVNFGAVLWLGLGSVPGAIAGVHVVKLLKQSYGPDVEDFTLIALGGVLAFVGVFTLVRSLLFPDHRSSEGAEHEPLHTWQRAAAVVIGVTTGFVIGITSAGSGTVIAVALIAVFKIPPRYVVGTDVLHAAILLWAAGISHWANDNIDFGLMGTLLLGSVPGVWLGSHFSVKVPEATLRTALGAVLIASAAATLNKAGVEYVPNLLLAAGGGAFALVVAAVMTGRLENPWVHDERERLIDGSAESPSDDDPPLDNGAPGDKTGGGPSVAQPVQA